MDSSLFARFPAALQRPLPLESGSIEGETPVGGLGGQSPPGPLPLRPRLPCPVWVPPPRPPPAEQRGSATRPEERTAAGAHRGDPRTEPSRGRGRPRGGQSRGSAVETPGAARRARLVSAAAGCGEPGGGRRDPAVPCPPGSVPVPGSARAALHSCASSVLCSGPSLRLFFPVSLSLAPSIHCLALSLSNLFYLRLLLRRSFPISLNPVSLFVYASVSLSLSLSFSQDACHSGL